METVSSSINVNSIPIGRTIILQNCSGCKQNCMQVIVRPVDPALFPPIRLHHYYYLTRSKVPDHYFRLQHYQKHHQSFKMSASCIICVLFKVEDPVEPSLLHTHHHQDLHIQQQGVCYFKTCIRLIEPATFIFRWICNSNTNRTLVPTTEDHFLRIRPTESTFDIIIRKHTSNRSMRI